MSKRQEDIFLWMPYWTAKYKLMRKILFSLLLETNRTKCFRCWKEMTENDYSIEHIEHWYNIDINKFWDLKNITFSHLVCNSKEKRHSITKRQWWQSTKYIWLSKRKNWKFLVRIKYNKKLHNLWTYENEKDAALVYDYYLYQIKKINYNAWNKFLYPEDFKHIENTDKYIVQKYNLN